jgi:FSR family fosmidomycin resistance protein-like MFS transporter
MASGGQHGLAQSLFQVGGNFGTALGPLVAAFFVLRFGQPSIAWFSLTALLAIVVLLRVGNWYATRGLATIARPGGNNTEWTALPRAETRLALGVLLALIFSKYFYLASLTSYYAFYLIEKFGVSVQSAQIHLFAFLGAVAAGTIIGGPVGDRIGRKRVIWWSILGALPFTLALPHANLLWTGVLSVLIGVIIASAFSAILVYAQELVPGKIGMVSGMFYGFAFGMGGLGAALLGWLADRTDIYFVYQVCAFLPAVGLLTVFLPNMKKVGVVDSSATASAS